MGLSIDDPNLGTIASRVKSPFISSKLGYESEEKLPNAKLEVIDRSGHYVHMDKPHELVQVLAEFLDEVA